jgi:hypothetical protein
MDSDSDSDFDSSSRSEFRRKQVPKGLNPFLLEKQDFRWLMPKVDTDEPMDVVSEEETLAQFENALDDGRTQSELRKHWMVAIVNQVYIVIYNALSVLTETDADNKNVLIRKMQASLELLMQINKLVTSFLNVLLPFGLGSVVISLFYICLLYILSVRFPLFNYILNLIAGTFNNVFAAPEIREGVAAAVGMGSKYIAGVTDRIVTSAKEVIIDVGTDIATNSAKNILKDKILEAAMKNLGNVMYASFLPLFLSQKEALSNGFDKIASINTEQLIQTQKLLNDVSPHFYETISNLKNLVTLGKEIKVQNNDIHLDRLTYRDKDHTELLRGISTMQDQMALMVKTLDANQQQSILKILGEMGLVSTPILNQLLQATGFITSTSRSTRVVERNGGRRKSRKMSGRKSRKSRKSRKMSRGKSIKKGEAKKIRKISETKSRKNKLCLSK